VHRHGRIYGTVRSGLWGRTVPSLGARLLIYGQRELLWQCHQIHNAQVTKSQLEIPQRSKSIQLPASIYHRGDSSCVGKFDFTLWRRILSAYSRCDMTLPEDKLPAIAGIASELRDIWRVDYFAGLWKPQLVRQLCWYLQRLAGYSRPIGRTSVYRAPSWSWASVDGPFDYRFDSGYEDAVLVSCYIESLSQHAPLGQVERGILEVEGYLFHLQSVSRTWFSNTTLDTHGSPLYPSLNGHLDQLNYYEEDQVWVLVLMGSFKDGHYALDQPLEGLLLEESEHNRFNRIGYWYKNHGNHAELDAYALSGQRQIVKII
jgi:hypothetical protein